MTYFSPKIIGYVKIKKSLLGHNTQPEKRNMKRFLVGKPEGNRQYEKPRHRWDDNIKADFKETLWKYVD
jgi:hypothetical protein